MVGREHIQLREIFILIDVPAFHFSKTKNPPSFGGP